MAPEPVDPERDSLMTLALNGVSTPPPGWLEAEGPEVDRLLLAPANGKFGARRAPESAS